jgi:hAT family C-terminal dimerisation region
MVQSCVDAYLERTRSYNGDIVVDWSELKGSGTLWKVSHMEFWQKIALDTSNSMELVFTKGLLQVAALLLAVPASESIDETAFSGSGQALTKERNSLSNANLEKMMVIRMFVKDKGWSMNRFLEFVKNIDQVKIEMMKDVREAEIQNEHGLSHDSKDDN